MLADIESKTTPGATFIAQNMPSPSSESFAQGRAASESQDNLLSLFNNNRRGGARGSSAAGSGAGGGSGLARPERPPNAFELWSEDARKSRAAAKREGDDDVNLDEELARDWKHLDEKEKDTYLKRHEEKMAKYHKDKDAYSKSKADAAKAAAASKEDKDGKDTDVDVDVDADVDADAEETQLKTQDEDVEMTNYDTEDAEDTQVADKADD